MKQEDLKKLLCSMSLEEKINQLSQLTGSLYLEGAELTGPLKEQGITEKEMQLAGSVIGTFGAETVKKLQERYMEKQPHHIPLLFMMDVINGFKTVFPIPLGQGATFEPELSEECARAAAKEAAASGVHVTFAPMADLVRDARWGRVMESTGEDTYLNSCFTEAMVKGFQGEDLGKKDSVAACVKHFAAYGAPEGGREYNNVELSEHTLREYYLPAYQAGIKAGAALVMTSFNTLNGIPSTGNKWLMRDVLRKEMGFDGVLISDWAAVDELIRHGYCENAEEAAICSLEAGVDIDMVAGIYAKRLEKLVTEGKVSEKLIDESVLRVLQLKNNLGLFENPYKGADEKEEKKWCLCEEHRELAKKAAEKSFVLLKNEEQILPLDMKKKIAFIGPYTDSQKILGAWSFIGDAEDAVSIKMAAEKVFDAEKVTYSRGSLLLGDQVHMEGFGRSFSECAGKEEQERMLEDALEKAKEADIVVMTLGEGFLQSGEAASRSDIRIPKIQRKLFKKVRKVNKNIVVVLFTGRPLDIRKISQKAKAVLCVWMPGTEGGHAIVDVLRGNSAPEGKLPMSFPYNAGQVPIHYNEYSTGRPSQGNDEKFCSRYLDIPNEPLYPFGYGLNYTRFSVSPIQLTYGEERGQVKAAVNVKNEGDRAGTEVVQLYLQDVAASMVRPVRELKDFRKVTLSPGESVEVNFEICEKDLRFFDEQGRYIAESGKFKIYVGFDSRTENEAEFVLLPE